MSHISAFNVHISSLLQYDQLQVWLPHHVREKEKKKELDFEAANVIFAHAPLIRFGHTHT